MNLKAREVLSKTQRNALQIHSLSQIQKEWGKGGVSPKSSVTIMDDKEFKQWNKLQKLKKKKVPKTKYKIITRRKGIWSIPDNF